MRERRREFSHSASLVSKDDPQQESDEAYLKSKSRGPAGACPEQLSEVCRTGTGSIPVPGTKVRSLAARRAYGRPFIRRANASLTATTQ
jgi:hypothetical protein